jgi:hypothetical protein
MSIEESSEARPLVRRARTVRGEVRFRMLCAPRFDYARAHHTVERVGDGVIFTSRGRDRTALRIRAVPMQVVNGGGGAEFTLSAGNSADFVLEPATLDGASPASAPIMYPVPSRKRLTIGDAGSLAPIIRGDGEKCLTVQH